MTEGELQGSPLPDTQMIPIPDPRAVSDRLDALPSSTTMTPAELGDTVAHIVWESFSDFLVAPELATLLEQLGIPLHDGIPSERVTGELLIFHLWAHTRAIQLSFIRRAPEPVLKAALDALHSAVFDDMAENGTPASQLPVFEQRVGARYAEYSQAARTSDDRVGEVALAHLRSAGEVETNGSAAIEGRLLTERAIELSNPLRDFLSDIELAEG